MRTRSMVGRLPSSGSSSAALKTSAWLREPTALVLHSTARALDPHWLHEETEEAVRALFEEGESANTSRSYASALKYWAAWYRLRYRLTLSLPVPVPAVIQSIVDHVERTTSQGTLKNQLPAALDRALVEGGFKGDVGALALNTVMHRLSVLSKVHQIKDLSNPARDPAVQELLRRVRRAYATRGVGPARKTALTQDPLAAMLATCTDGLMGVRDRALLLFCWASGGRRRSEVSAAVMENLLKVNNRLYLYHLGHSKTDQLGAENNSNAEKPMADMAADSLTTWLDASKILTGPIFRRIRAAATVAEPLSAEAVALIVKRRAQLAGLEGDFGAHSLRSGFVTEAGRQNIPLGDTMAMTGHRSVQTMIRYFQTGAIGQTRAARLLGDDPSSDGGPPDSGVH
ncbi:MAG TPA: site-specific integrase [Steroidobacteraceae bacterium]